MGCCVGSKRKRRSTSSDGKEATKSGIGRLAVPSSYGSSDSDVDNDEEEALKGAEDASDPDEAEDDDDTDSIHSGGDNGGGAVEAARTETARVVQDQAQAYAQVSCHTRLMLGNLLPQHLLY